MGDGLAKLDEASVTDFYMNIEKKSTTDIKRYMGYHDINTHKNKNEKYILRSCERYQAIITELAKFYEHYYDLYLSYKHGLRIAPISARNGIYSYLYTDKRYNVDQSFGTYRAPILAWIIKSVMVCDLIKGIFDRLYTPLIRKTMCEFLCIEKDMVFIDSSISKTFKAEGDLIPNPTYHFSTSGTHPWWNVRDSSLDPFY